MSGAGRPSKYKPEFCQQLIDHMAGGLSFESFAGVIEVNRDTLYEWASGVDEEKNLKHPDFNEAKKIATEKCQLYWEKLAIEGIWDVTEYENGKPSYKKSLNSTLWIFNMKNRFQWRDRQPDEVPVIVNNNTATPLTPEETADLVKAARGTK